MADATRGPEAEAAALRAAGRASRPSRTAVRRGLQPTNVAADEVVVDELERIQDLRATLVMA